MTDRFAIYFAGRLNKGLKNLAPTGHVATGHPSAAKGSTAERVCALFRSVLNLIHVLLGVH